MAELNLQVRLRAFDQMSRTFANVGRAGQRLLRQFDQNRNTLHRFDAQLRDIGAYRRQQQAIRQNSQDLTQMRQRVRDLHNQLRNGAAMGQSTAATRRLRDEYNRARQSVSQLEQTRSREQQRLAQLSQRLRAAGIDTRNLASAEARLRREAGQTNEPTGYAGWPRDSVRRRRASPVVMPDWRFRPTPQWPAMSASMLRSAAHTCSVRRCVNIWGKSRRRPTSR